MAVMHTRRIEEKGPLLTVICLSIILIICIVVWQVFDSFRSVQTKYIKTTNVIHDDLFK